MKLDRRAFLAAITGAVCVPALPMVGLVPRREPDDRIHYRDDGRICREAA